MVPIVQTLNRWVFALLSVPITCISSDSFLLTNGRQPSVLRNTEYAEAESKETRGVWDSMPELTITPPYVHSTLQMKGRGESNINVWVINVFPAMKLIFPKQNYNVQFPSSYTHISVRDLYISRISLPILPQGNMWTDPGNI
jgi:hypothetical protein